MNGPDYWDSIITSWQPSLAHRLWRAHSDAINIRLLRRWLPPRREAVLKTDLFDEAVGRGLYCELAAGASRVVGFDISPATVRAASARYPELEAHVGSVLALPFADGTFDAIVSNSTLDHFESHAKLRAALGELARALAPRGRMVITLDNGDNPVVALRTSRLAGTLNRVGVVPYFVGKTYGRRGLAEALDEAGFDVVDVATVMHCPPQLAAWWRARRHLGSDHEDELERAHLRRVLRFERLAAWPTRGLTAHFVGALAIRR